MPFDSQGNFTRVMNWQEDAANSIPILASRHDDEDDNFANGFNETMCRDGRTAMTGQLKMNNNKIVNVANATASGDVVNKGQLDSVQTTLQTNINAKANDNNVVKLTGNQTKAGTLTLSSSPILPTPSASDNSQKGATTAFVKTAVSGGITSSTNLDFANSVVFSTSTYTAPSNGVIFITGNRNDVDRFIWIEGVMLVRMRGCSSSGAQADPVFTCQLGSGQKFSWSKSSSTIDLATDYYRGVFVPYA